MRRRMWFPTKGALTEAWRNFADNPALIASLMAPEMGQSVIALSGTERKCINDEQSAFATPGASRISRTVLIANLAEAQAALPGNLSCKKHSLVTSTWAARYIPVSKIGVSMFWLAPRHSQESAFLSLKNAVATPTITEIADNPAIMGRS